ncbi:Histidine kinase [Rhodovastum atsumiense]|uniref:histidine kinase n=1 Tax=Rhodovastum atsumiense TaxID=504468 RepID=A0A5M6IVT1_9PROT|nr:sensor histidine kinase [Rhodovastum atsumiense]KAA5612426.1 sensor histidine kinase [Rhodovastum atsumiense]CAH2600333.1 Histidine kinase [Rhodovastum atsumiense]
MIRKLTRVVPASLTARLSLLTCAWVACGLVAAWLLVSGQAAAYIERAFDERLTGLLDAVVAGTDLNADGTPVMRGLVSEPRFDRPFSGVYWQIEGPGGRMATSRSLWDQILPRETVPHDEVLMRKVPGPAGQHLRIAERDIALAEEGGRLRVLVAMAHDETYHEIRRLRGGLAVGFALLGAGLVVGTALQVSLLLAPLRRLRRAVADLRAGQRGRLELTAGAEVQPLIGEIDALVAQNRATVERARGHIGNLAHALRTDLAVMRNALEAPDGTDLALIRHQLAATERLVQHHLARARTAALTGATAEDVPVRAVVEELSVVLRRLFAARGMQIRVDGDGELRARCERQDLAEMLGNLMENACKWGRTLVTVTVAYAPAQVLVEVSDDGPGLPEQEIPQALSRGGRLDEAAPGTGLGLAIVADLALLYGGALSLGRATLGGLRAGLSLPAAPAIGTPRRPGGEN